MNLKNYKKAIAVWGFTPIISCGLYLIVVISLDPFHFIHNKGISIGFLNNMRIQAAGAINRGQFDSLILGTSVFENSSAKSASKKLDSKFINISISGGDYFERSLLLNYALKKSKLKEVIYSLDRDYFARSIGKDEYYPIAGYSYLYDDLTINDIKVFANTSVLKCVGRNMILADKCLSKDFDFDRPNAWITLPQSATFGGLDKWLNAKQEGNIKRAFLNLIASATNVITKEFAPINEQNYSKEIEASIAHIDKYLLDIARQHPDTSFQLIFPPYSRIRYAQWHQDIVLKAKIHEAVVRHFAQASTELKNVNVYGYEDQDFLDEIKNYSDPGHFDEWINEIMFDDIKEGRHLLTMANVESYISIAREKAMSFDLVGLAHKVEAHLENSNKLE